jgi:hypothetical protein
MIVLLASLMTFGIILLAPSLTDAQLPAVDGDCPTFVREALVKLDTTCNALDRNSMCYGNTLVSVTFNQEVDTALFSKPSDKTLLRDVELVETAPLDEAKQQWGLVLMNVQANVPGTMPGQGVVFVLMGDAQLENDVDNALTEGNVTAVDAVITADANVRSAPTMKANVLASVPANTVLKADRRSPDGEWYRVSFNDLPAWVSRTIVQPSAALDALPNPTRTQLSPMQSFQFSGGIGSPSCKQAAGSLLIQGPDDVVVDLEANGVRIRLASTILLTSSDNQMQVTTLSGAAQVDDVIVPAGFTTEAALDENNQVTGKFQPAAPVEQEVLDDLELFDDIPEDLMHYTPDLEQAAENQDEYAGKVLEPEDFGLDDPDCEVDPDLPDCIEVTDVPTATETPPTPETGEGNDPCLVDPTLAECATETEVTIETPEVTPDLCAVDPTLPECTPDDGGDLETPEITPDPCSIDPTLPECGGAPTVTPDDGGGDEVETPEVTPDPCAVDPTLPECNPDDGGDDGGDTGEITPDPCAVDPTLPQCNPDDGGGGGGDNGTPPGNAEPTLEPCAADPTLPGCTPDDPTPTLDAGGGGEPTPDNGVGGEMTHTPSASTDGTITEPTPDGCASDPALPECLVTEEATAPSN